MDVLVKRSSDFELSGDGSAPAWSKAPWNALRSLEPEPAGYATRVKALYSESGLYVLFDCEDRELHCTITEDMLALYTEDVVEVFLDPAGEVSGEQRTYFEYELSPLDKELVLLIPNDGERIGGWRPWNYGDADRVKHATAIRGGEKLAMAGCQGWSAECFIPFSLLGGLVNSVPESGSVWRGNFYRIDYDSGAPVHWAWSPIHRARFHDCENFGRLHFE